MCVCGFIDQPSITKKQRASKGHPLSQQIKTMKFFSNNKSIIVLIFSIAILIMLCLCVDVSLARTPPQAHPLFSSSSSASSSSQAFSHSKQGPNSAHDHQPANSVAASLRRIPPSRPNPTQNRLRPGLRG